MIRKISLILLFLTTANNAFAGTVFTPGSSKTPDALGIPIQDNGFIGTSLETGRSYCCDFHAKTNDFINQIDLTYYNISSQPVATATDRSLVTPSNLNNNLFRRLCLTPPISGLIGFKIINVTHFDAAAEMSTYCVETTLYGGYNTNANRYNFLEVLNTTNSTINFKVFAQNFDGTTVINNASYSVPAGRRFDVDIHGSAGIGKYGLLKVTHDGPFGALQAGVSFYKADFTQTAHVPLKPRDQVH